MAQYYVNMNNYPTGALSSPDWSFRQNNGGASATVLSSTDGNLIRTDATAVGTKVMAYTPLNGANDVEALIKFRLASDFGKQGIVSLRYGGNTEANTAGYTLSGSFIGSVGTLAIDEGSTGYVAWTQWNYLANTTYWVRFRVIGNSLRAKVWTDGTAEPSAWALDVTNSVATTGSFSGFHQYRHESIFYLYASFATDGDTAPATIEEYNQWKREQIDAANNALPPSTPIVGFSGGYGGPFADYGSALGLAKKNTGLVINSSLHGHTVTSPVLKQAHRVAIAKATHAHAATSPVIKQLHNLLIANTVHSITSSSPVIAIKHNLAIDSAIHQIVSDNVIIVTGYAAVPQDAVHNITSNNISLQQHQKLIVQSATHAHAVTSPTIIEAKRLAISSTAHSLSDSGVGKLDIAHYLAVESTTHNISSLSPSVLQSNLLVVQSTSHATTSTSVDIIQFTLLGKPDSAVHSLSSDDISLSQKQILAIDNTIQLLKSGEIAKIFDWTELGVDFGNYKPGWNNSGNLTVAELDGVGIYIPSSDQDGAFELTDITGGILIPNNIQKGKF